MKVLRSPEFIIAGILAILVSVAVTCGCIVVMREHSKTKQYLSKETEVNKIAIMLLSRRVKTLEFLLQLDQDWGDVYVPGTKSTSTKLKCSVSK